MNKPQCYAAIIYRCNGYGMHVYEAVWLFSNIIDTCVAVAVFRIVVRELL